MNKTTNIRVVQTYLLLLTIVVLCASIYLQYFVHLHPCPLCLMQRSCVVLIGIFSLFTCYMATRNKRITILIVAQFISAVAGIVFALRQIWLQSLPYDHDAMCLPGLDILMNYFSWADVAYTFLWGSAECGAVTWRLLGFSMAAWSALYFVIVAIVSGYAWYIVARIER